jgi:hypothetical protein
LHAIRSLVLSVYHSCSRRPVQQPYGCTNLQDSAGGFAVQVASSKDISSAMHGRHKPRTNYAGKYNACTLLYIIHMPVASQQPG